MIYKLQEGEKKCKRKCETLKETRQCIRIKKPVLLGLGPHLSINGSLSLRFTVDNIVFPPLL